MATKKAICVYGGELKELQAGDTLGASSDASQLQGRSVSTSAPKDGEALVWDAASSSWKPAAVSGSTNLDDVWIYSGL